MKYCLFGAGDYGKRAISLLGKEKIKCIFDNNPIKWGTFVEKIPVKSISDHQKSYKEDCIIIAVSQEKEDVMIRQLEDNGIHNYICYQELVERVTKEKILSRTDYLGVYQKAIHWIMNHSIEGKGIICNTNLQKSYPEVTGYYIPSLLRWGYRELACSYARWLCSIQKPDGSWYNTENTAPYIFDTAQVLKGLLAIREVVPQEIISQVDTHIFSGCEWIFAQMQEDGRLVTPTTNAWGTNRDVCDEVIHIYCLSPLLEAAELFEKPSYREKALRIWAYYKKNYQEKIMNFSLLSHFYAYLIEALLDIGEEDMAREAMHKMEAYQKPNGAVPAYHHCDWVCSTGLFQLALVWFRLGDIDRGNHAFAYACKLQNPSGGWFGSYLSEENSTEYNTYFPTEEISWAVKYFLDALYYKNKAEFEVSKDSFLPHIEKEDGRYQVIFRELQNLKENKENLILDVGCGKGRYLNNLMDDFPDNDYVAIDLSEGVMQFLESDIIEKKQGSLTNIPYEDDSFDLVYACESLEHAIDIESALREIARVTKTGGKIVIIDKNLKELGRMEIGLWEQWFDEEDLKEKLERYCSGVVLHRAIPYEGKTNDELFCAWIGTVKGRKHA